MITKIDVGHFGLFNDYSWDTVISKDETFKRMNIIYGRNYSGKTTLARMFKCIEDSIMHKDYLNCNFKITLSNGTKITQANLQDFAVHNKIRVYNTDFVRENLGWLYSEDGAIKPFTILGAKNVEIDKRINTIVEILGSSENSKGLVFELDKAQRELVELRRLNSVKEDALEDKLRKRANDFIKLNSNLFLITSSKKSYTIADIKIDVDEIEKNIQQHLLDADATESRKQLLKEATLPDIDPLTESKPKFSEYYKECSEILQRKIKPSNPITELINDSLLQEWVRQGIDKHFDKRQTCGFCGGKLDVELWKKLDEHFSKESEELRNALKGKIDKLELAKRGLSEFMNLKREQFYGTLQVQYESTLKDWNTFSKSYMESIDQLIIELRAREKDIFRDRELPEIIDASDQLFETIKFFNGILTAHNRKSSSLATDQLKARKELRFAHIVDIPGMLTT
jgi:AAA domain